MRTRALALVAAGSLTLAATAFAAVPASAADGHGTYPVPISDPGLDGYTVVDISLEPFDGNAAHSRNSLLRGDLG